MELAVLGADVVFEHIFRVVHADDRALGMIIDKLKRRVHLAPVLEHGDFGQNGVLLFVCFDGDDALSADGAREQARPCDRPSGRAVRLTERERDNGRELVKVFKVTGRGPAEKFYEIRHTVAGKNGVLGRFVQPLRKLGDKPHRLRQLREDLNVLAWLALRSDDLLA